PIFDGGALAAQADARAGRRRELLAAYGASIVSALTDVENALVGLRKSAEEERLRAVAVEAARRAYRITEERLREGTIDVVTLLNTQQTLFQAQDAAVQARYQRLLAVVSLHQALGGGFSREDVAAARLAEAAR
ncbi:MAG TPA: TolC family protein, partial [Beijerinckiaceae bacterium]